MPTYLYTYLLVYQCTYPPTSLFIHPSPCHLFTFSPLVPSFTPSHCLNHISSSTKTRLSSTSLCSLSHHPTPLFNNHWLCTISQSPLQPCNLSHSESPHVHHQPAHPTL